MKASEIRLVEFLEGSKQFTVPIYQRSYNWTNTQCEQFLNDILRVAKDEKIPGHFIGSIVYIKEGLFQVAEVPQLEVIDGQQRLTTILLLLAALSRVDNVDKTGIKTSKIKNSFLFNNDESGDKRYKLVLTSSDNTIFQNVLEDCPLPENVRSNVEDNFKFFQDKLAKYADKLSLLWPGIKKLTIVDIALDSSQDNPQRIFESLNSTGLDLSQTDLIRNYVLMGRGKKRQDQIYKKYWLPMEKSFEGLTENKIFDKFVRDYLTIKTGRIPILGNIYNEFKEYARNKDIEELMSDIRSHSEIFVQLCKNKTSDPKLNRIICDMNVLGVNVAYPFLMESLIEKIDECDRIEIFSMVESYVFRRAICDIPSNSLNKTFANLTREIQNTEPYKLGEINKESYLKGAKVVFNLKKSYRIFPSDNEFKDRLVHKNVYTSKIHHYLLYKLENFERKERVNEDDYTIEHIMPQSLTPEWKEELGPEWKQIHEEYLHTIGNLTLTAYNTPLGNRPFLKKRDLEKGGFATSPIKLNESLAQLEHWNKKEIQKRADLIAEKAMKIWKFPTISEETLEKYAPFSDKYQEHMTKVLADRIDIQKIITGQREFPHQRAS